MIDAGMRPPAEDDARTIPLGRVESSGFRVQGFFELRVPGSGFKVQGSGFWISGFQVSVLEFRRLGSGFQVWSKRVDGCGLR